MEKEFLDMLKEAIQSSFKKIQEKEETACCPCKHTLKLRYKSCDGGLKILTTDICLERFFFNHSDDVLTIDLVDD